MKFPMFFSVVILCIAITGCYEQRLEIPPLREPFLLVSHVKEAKLTFIDLERNEVVSAEKIHFPLTQIKGINNGNMIGVNQNERELVLLNFNKGRVESFLELNGGITALDYEPLLNKLYVADKINNQVHAVDMEKREVVSSVDVGAFPTELLAVNGKLYVLNGESHDIAVINATRNEVEYTFSVLERPSGMHFDGELLWIGGHGSFGNLNRSIFAYQPETGELIHEINVGLMPIAFFGDVDSRYLYVLCHGDHELYKVDKIDYQVIDSISVGENPNFLTGDNEKLFVSSLDGDLVSIIDKKSFKLMDKLPVAAGPYSLVLGDIR